MMSSQQQTTVHQGPILDSILQPQWTTAAKTQSPTHLKLHPLLSKFRQNEDIIALTLPNILSPTECQTLIQRAESQGFETAMVNVGQNGNAIRIPGYRDGYRCIIDDPAFADVLWERVKAHVPATYDKRPVVGMNERLRFLKYGSGDKFQAHMDGEYRRLDGSNHVTKITIQFYLNQDCQGGATTFLQENRYNQKNALTVAVAPKTGQALIFQHDLVHEGSAVQGGFKYVIRTDILYGPRSTR